MKKATRQPDGLIQVLLDEGAEFGDRHDAAMDLGKYDEQTVEDALASIACNPQVEEDLADASGESLAEIWCRKNRINENVLLKLNPVSERIALATLQASAEHLATHANSLLAKKR